MQATDVGVEIMKVIWSTEGTIKQRDVYFVYRAIESSNGSKTHHVKPIQLIYLRLIFQKMVSLFVINMKKLMTYYHLMGLIFRLQNEKEMKSLLLL